MVYYRDIPKDLKEFIPAFASENFLENKVGIRSAFTWAWTKQGHRFWLLIEQERFDEARKMTKKVKQITLKW